MLRTLANTGIQAAPTTLGTAPVYLRYYFQIMKGKNPDGTKYADPVYYVSYFRAGEAVHYFNRGSYGWPQSLGCVELPLSDAKKAYPYLTYGSLVTVAPRQPDADGQPDRLERRPVCTRRPSARRRPRSAGPHDAARPGRLSSRAGQRAEPRVDSIEAPG